MEMGIVASGWWPREFVTVTVRYAFRGVISRIYTQWPLCGNGLVLFWLPYAQQRIEIQKLKILINGTTKALSFVSCRIGVVAVARVDLENSLSGRMVEIAFDLSLADSGPPASTHEHSDTTAFALAKISWLDICQKRLALRACDLDVLVEIQVDISQMLEEFDLSIEGHSRGTTVTVEDEVRRRMINNDDREYDNLATRIADRSLGIEGPDGRLLRRVHRTPDIPKILAFYLPQFHPIPENDAAWGVGFTEWANVRVARPNFRGHYQPRIPTDLGYYDLRDPSIMDRQAALAKQYGVHGFCYYYYNFSGQRVLDMPLERILQTGKPDIPFCLAWANENWTRTWVGESNKPILQHEYNAETNLSVILDLLRYMRHPLYIRVGTRPLLLVYRANVIPNVNGVVNLWRDICRREGIGEVFLASVEAAELASSNVDPQSLGFDAAVEFPPHNAGASMSIRELQTNEAFRGLVFDYPSVALRYASAPAPAYRRSRCLIGAWDNTARRQTSPQYLQIVHLAPSVPGSRRSSTTRVATIQLMNSLSLSMHGNEWSEGTYLEPDERFGYGFLKLVRAAKAAASADAVGISPELC